MPSLHDTPNFMFDDVHVFRHAYPRDLSSCARPFAGVAGADRNLDIRDPRPAFAETGADTMTGPLAPRRNAR